jgi:hypothetical protein
MLMFSPLGQCHVPCSWESTRTAAFAQADPQGTGAAVAGVHFQRLNAFLRRHLGGTKILLAVVFFLLAAVMICGW